MPLEVQETGRSDPQGVSWLILGGGRCLVVL